MKNFFTLTLCFLTLSITAQDAAGYWIGIHHYASHTEGELAGMTTWRLYLHMLHPDDFLSACTGSDEYPWIMESTSSPAWYQHPEASETFANAINPAFFTAFPELEYDSWLTIGADNSLDPIELLSFSDPSYDAFAAFEAGENVMANTFVGNGWATLFPGLGADNAGFAGDDLKVLIGQLTTAGTISGTIHVQIFPQGIQVPNLQLQLSFILVESEVPGCTSTFACNFNPESTIDDGSCLENDECGFCGGEGIADGTCDCNGNTLDALGICGGDCPYDYDGDGICDNQEILGCTYSTATNYNPDATSDDGSCLGAFNSCPSDLSGNGNVGSEDLLIFLADFDLSCDEISGQ